MRLRHGVTAQYAVEEVGQVIRDLGNLLLSNASMETLAEYVTWAETSERRLRALFTEPDFRDNLYTSRFWQLFSWDGPGAGIGAKPFILMLAAEKDLQLRLLREAQAELQRLSDWAIEHRDRPVGVYDTTP